MIFADFSAAGWRTSSYSSDSGNCVQVAFAPTAWRTSSYSGNSGNCVQVAFAPASWRTSSYSGNSSNCVQVAGSEQAVGVRDSKHPAAGTLVFPTGGWAHFLRAL